MVDVSSPRSIRQSAAKQSINDVTAPPPHTHTGSPLAPWLHCSTSTRYTLQQQLQPSSSSSLDKSHLTSSAIARWLAGWLFCVFHWSPPHPPSRSRSPSRPTFTELCAFTELPLPGHQSSQHSTSTGVDGSFWRCAGLHT